MEIFVVNEVRGSEKRTVLTPESAARLVADGWTVSAEHGLGRAANFADDDFERAGVEWRTRQEGLARADLVARLHPPTPEEIDLMKPHAIHVSLLRPFRNGPLLEHFVGRRIRAFALELIPRISLAQPMDVLTSQSNLAGYAAALRGAMEIPSLTPMMVTAAGTISPARFLILGAGVAGLQAIATARRLGAAVEAYDARPAVEEQVRSLGARFLKFDLEGARETDQGYATALCEEEHRRQEAALEKVCGRANVIITTAKIFGGPAPRLITESMLDRMGPGSVVIDLAVEDGGNVEGSRNGEIVERKNGVRVIGLGAAENAFPQTASRLLAANLASLIGHFSSPDGGRFEWRENDEILRACAVSDGRALLFPKPNR